jgi:hypothetical protein
MNRAPKHFVPDVKALSHQVPLEQARGPTGSAVAVVGRRAVQQGDESRSGGFGPGEGWTRVRAFLQPFPTAIPIPEFRDPVIQGLIAHSVLAGDDRPRFAGVDFEERLRHPLIGGVLTELCNVAQIINLDIAEFDLVTHSISNHEEKTAREPGRSGENQLP